MLNSGAFGVVAALSVATSVASADDGYRMNDLGGTVMLPAGYASELWTDAELKAKHPRGRILKLWLHPWQVDVSDAARADWETRIRTGLEAEGVSDVKLVSSETVELAGRQTALMGFDLAISGGRGVAYAGIFTGAGHTVFVRVVAAKRVARQAEQDLRSTLTALTLDSGPLEASGSGVESGAGFAATLADGWRVPFRDELDLVREFTAKLGEESLSPEECWVAIRPPAVGAPDILYACRAPYHVGPLDEYSFEAVEAEEHQRWFGRAEKKVPNAEQVTVGDRVGMLYRPPVASGPVRLALAPFDGGMMTLWGIAGQATEAELDETMRELISTVTFTGPNGGAPIVGVGSWLSYYARHRSSSPLVWGPVLGVLGLGAVLVTRLRRRERDFDVDE